jgi:nucleoside-diphosphate-sugar epimerase
MPRTLISGGSGTVGRFVVEHLLDTGHEVMVMARHAPPAGFFSKPVSFVQGWLDPDQDQSPLFGGIDFFVHAAFEHVPGKYRGGEGGDPMGFVRRNLHGSTALFRAARKAGTRRVAFLSSRAVYGLQPAGEQLLEGTEPQPETLYGVVKLDAEKALLALAGEDFVASVLRLTGVYGPPGPGRMHKWSALIQNYLAGGPVAARAGTEVHGADVAAAVRLMLEAPQGKVSGEVFNVSDIVVDRRDLLAIVKQVTCSRYPLPAADTSPLNVMSTKKLGALGWQAGGWPLLERTVWELAGTTTAG